MSTFGQREYSIRELFDSYQRKELKLSPKFQRRAVWEAKAKSYFIDSIIRDVPIPRIFIREKSSLDMQVSKEIVDGQQRLRTIFDFISDGFKINPAHNEEYGDRNFSQLPEGVKKNFLNYPLSAVVLIDLEDNEIFNIFARLNTYSVKLNNQELLNSQFFGYYKQLIYKLADEYRKFWIDSGLLSEKAITRMDDANLISQLLSVIVTGKIESNSFSKDCRLYKQYDDNFPLGMQIERNFKVIMDLIGQIYGDTIRETAFSNIPLFYSLFLVLYHMNYKLDSFAFRRVQIKEHNMSQLKTALDEIDVQLKAAQPKGVIEQLALTLKKNTTTPRVRIKRCDLLGNLLANYLN